MRRSIVRLAACACALAVATLAPRGPARADILDVFGDIVEGAVGVVDDVFSGLGALPGLLFASGVFYLPGPFGYVPALVQGVVVNEVTNGLIETRHPTEQEYAFAQSVFGDTLPARDRIIITNLTGLGERAFVTVDKVVAGKYMVNIGKNGCDTSPLTCTTSNYPTPGQLFIHEMTHVWQLHQASFQPEQVYENIYTQIVEGRGAYAYTCGMGWDTYGPEQQANITDTWYRNRPAQSIARMQPPGSACEYQYVVENLRKGRLTARHASAGGTAASVSRTQDYMEVWWADPNGSLQAAWWQDGGAWSRHELAPAGSVAGSGGIAAVSRIPTSMEIWWIHPNGSVQGDYWYEGGSWTRYELAPPGSAVATGGITAVSRNPNTMEVWWIGPGGSVQGAYWYQGGSWARYEIAPINSASSAGGIASLSRVPHSLEIWWTGGNGSVQAAYWYEGGNWTRYELAPGGQASPAGGITAVSRIPSSMEVWWIGGNGSVQSSYWYEGGSWTRHELAPGGSAADSSSLAAASRIPTSMELWWVSPNGTLEDAHWYEGQPWRRFGMTGSQVAPQSGGITATSRIPTSMEFWASGTVRHSDGFWHDSTTGHAWYEGASWNHYDFAYHAGTPLLPNAVPATGLTDFGTDFLYAVRADGTLDWYEHRIQIDNRPSPFVTKVEGAEAMMTRGAFASGYRQQAAAIAVAQPAPPPTPTTEIVTRPIGVEAAVLPSPTTVAEVVTRPIDVDAVALPPPPRYAHSWQGPRNVGSGWNGFQAVIPAGTASLYGLTPDGILKWYHHDGYQNGSPIWKGPIDVGSGWQGFTRVVAGGQGVLYGIATDGSLVWYKHADHANATTQPTWWGPKTVGSGWAGLAHVFGAGEGVIYAVHPDGRLMWYRHTGYGDGTTSWEGPKEIGTGWAGFEKIFSPGEGQIYAIRPDGTLTWYRHTGYRDGRATWEGPDVLTSGWGDAVHVFPVLWPPPSVLR